MRRRIMFVVMLATAAFVVVLIHRVTLPAVPAGPVDVAWDREACAHCRMHVGDPRFAAQLHTTSGEVLNFDDAGCLLQHVAAAGDDVHAIYFHAQHGDEWIGSADVRFVTGQNTPMGSGLGAVRDDGRPGLIDFAAALQRAGEQHAEVTP
jgi:hypothetical protein